MLVLLGRGARQVGRLLGDEQAATATEYAVLLALIIAVAIAAITTYGNSLNSEYQDINSTMFGS